VIVAGHEFELLIGLAPVSSPGVVGEELVRPPSSVGAYLMTVQVVADGFSAREGESWRNELTVTVDVPYPTLTLHLTPEPQRSAIVARSIKATYSTAGQTMGFAVRPIAVVRDAVLLATTSGPAPGPALDIALVTEWEPPDLTVRIHRGKQEQTGRLLWTFESPHDVELPDAELDTDIGTNPEAYARMIVDEVPLHEHADDLFAYLKGRGREVADQVPLEVWPVLRAVADRVRPRPPSVLLLSEEPYVPWELASPSSSPSAR
jgi:hypothetical protein